MNRLDRLREYRSRLVNEKYDRLEVLHQKYQDEHGELTNLPKDERVKFIAFMDKVQARIDLLNVEIGKLEEIHGLYRETIPPVPHATVQFAY